MVSPRTRNDVASASLIPGRASASDDLTRLRQFPAIPLGTWPTPIDRIERRDSPDILVKRDDLCGHGRGGAKARKIEHLVGYLRARGRDELIATAGNVTNLVFDLLPALRRWGIRSHLFILDDPPVLPRDRERIFEGVRDEVELLGPGRVHAFRRMAAAYVRRRATGARPFVALPGLSHPMGVVGNAQGFIEMLTQQRDAREPMPGTVFVTAATGTTLAGFLLGEHAVRSAGGPAVRIVGVQVYPGAIRRATLALLRWTERFLRLEGRVPAHRIEIVSSALHGGFGRYPEELSTLCDRVASETAIRIDPIFGGKTWAVMEAALASKRDPRPTLYWHCGYTPEWRVLGGAVRRAGDVS
jgi:1-aminocyclopropane-1-carboxylate deaminase/D-cysteine desulfhydrase-like pyridoxal-dependent ACC family enzyme